MDSKHPTKAKLKPTKSAYGFLIRSLAQDAPLCSDKDGWVRLLVLTDFD